MFLQNPHHHVCTLTFVCLDVHTGVCDGSSLAPVSPSPPRWVRASSSHCSSSNRARVCLVPACPSFWSCDARCAPLLLLLQLLLLLLLMPTWNCALFCCACALPVALSLLPRGGEASLTHAHLFLLLTPPAAARPPAPYFGAHLGARSRMCRARLPHHSTHLRLRGGFPSRSHSCTYTCRCCSSFSSSSSSSN